MGNAVIVKYDENKLLLFDPGPIQSSDKLINFLNKQNPQDLIVFITNPATRKSGGLNNIIKNFNISKLYRCELNWNNEPFKSAIRSAKNKDINTIKAYAGQIINISDDLSIEILSPPKGLIKDIKFYRENNSLVARIVYKNKKILLASDSRFEAEGYIIENTTDLKSDILYTARNGRSGSTSLELISMVRPQFIVIPSGKISYRAGDDVIERTSPKNTGAVVYRLDLNKMIIFVTDGKKIIAGLQES
ncbi:MAG: hypothetical protein SNJ70_05665 [Armatimonadota bacterium]